jgi:hypothetical protein
MLIRLKEPVTGKQKIMENNINFNTPLLFLIFNRPDTTQKVFDAIRQARPKYLYVAADGPRSDRICEKEKCETTRAIIKQVDWDCEVKTLFREKNLGCGKAVSSAITWFFDNVEQGIILEDDCLPDETFFGFCENMLEKYQNDERIMMITGLNYMVNELSLLVKESYIFSRYFAIWGWATWKRAWKQYDIKMNGWETIKSQDKLQSFYFQDIYKKHFFSIFDAACKKEIDTWDIQWFFSCLFNNGLSIVPKVNLISNIGIIGTHTSEDLINNFFPVFNIDNKNIVHPFLIYPDYFYDEFVYKRIINTSAKQNIKVKIIGIIVRVYYFIKSIIK